MDKNERKTLDATTFEFGETKFTFGDIPLTAAIYLIAYGARQSSGDTSAAYASFVGETDDGSPAANPMTEKKRVAIAKELGVTTYNDVGLVDREALADMYFAKALADKWARICDGTLTVGSRGSRLTSDESRLMAMAEIGVLEMMSTKAVTKKAAITKRRASRTELADANDAAVFKTIIADWLEANRAVYTERLAREKADAKASADQMKSDGFTF